MSTAAPGSPAAIDGLRTLPGLLQAAEAGQVPRGSRVVCTVTGNGLKDPDWALAGAPSATMVPVDALAAAEALDLA